MPAYKNFTKPEVKYLGSVETCDVNNIKDHIAVNTADGKIKFAYVREDSAVLPARFISPPLNILHGQGLSGVGGRAKLEDGTEAEEKYSVVCTALPLQHKSVYESNPTVNIPAQVDHMWDVLAAYGDAFIDTKLANPTVHVVQYQEANKTAAKFCKAEKGSAEFTEALRNAFMNNSQFAFEDPSGEAKKTLQVETKGFKFTAQPFMEPGKNGKLRKVDDDVMKIFEAGDVPSNPYYKHAKMVVDKHAQGFNFNRITVTHRNKKIVYPVFGVNLGRGSTIVVEFEVGPYSFSKNDGINLYIVAILVLKDEAYIPTHKEVQSKYASNDEEEEDGDKKREHDGEENGAKRQKTEPGGPEAPVASKYA